MTVDCRHDGELETEDGDTFTCVACGYSETSFTVEYVRAYLGLPSEENPDA